MEQRVDESDCIREEGLYEAMLNTKRKYKSEIKVIKKSKDRLVILVEKLMNNYDPDFKKSGKDLTKSTLLIAISRIVHGRRLLIYFGEFIGVKRRKIFFYCPHKICVLRGQTLQNCIF